MDEEWDTTRFHTPLQVFVIQFVTGQKTEGLFVVYYESLKRELKTKPIYEFRCDERLQTKLFVLLLWIVKSRDKDKNYIWINKRDSCEWDGWVSDRDVIGSPSIFKKTRRDAVLAKLLSIFVLSCPRRSARLKVRNLHDSDVLLKFGPRGRRESLLLFILNHKRESYRQKLYMDIGTMKV